MLFRSVPTSWQDEALARHGVSREVPCICELIGKAVGGILAVKWFGFWGICIATPLAWFLAMVYCGILVRHFMGKRLASVTA